MCGEKLCVIGKTPEVKIGAASWPILMCGAVTGKGKYVAAWVSGPKN
jgi:hypothetical protein